jgi:predicted DsbA family dithiol-disulfide isomerase
LRRLEEEFGDAVTLVWRTFLLRPVPDPARTLEAFRAYTRSWLRPAGEDDAPAFRPWASDAGPPTHSVPPHLVAKAAARLGPDAFGRVHAALLRAYFGESRDVTHGPTLQAIWGEAGLPDDAFAATSDPSVVTEVVEEHNAAVRAGITGVPAVAMEGIDVPIVGAMPYATYRRWIQRRLAGEI